MLSGLLDIHDSWKNQLDQHGEPYRLKLWLFDPWLSASQVVCEIGDIEGSFYTEIGYKPDYSRSIDLRTYGSLADRMSRFDWEYRWNEVAYDNTDKPDPADFSTLEEYEAEKRWFEKLLRKSHRTDRLPPNFGKIEELYWFREGNVWIGERSGT